MLAQVDWESARRIRTGTGGLRGHAACMDSGCSTPTDRRYCLRGRRAYLCSAQTRALCSCRVHEVARWNSGGRTPAAFGGFVPEMDSGIIRARSRKGCSSDGAAAARVSRSPLGQTSLSVLAAAAHPCAACPGNPGYGVLGKVRARGSTRESGTAALTLTSYGGIPKRCLQHMWRATWTWFWP